MHATTYPLITRDEAEAARHTVCAHFNDLIADANDSGDWQERQKLEDEAERWIHRHEITPERATDIIDCAPEGEKDAVRRFLDGGLR